MITVATVLYAGAWVYAPLSPHGGDNNGAFVLVFFGGLLYLITLAICVAQMIALWRAKRSGGQSPRRPALGGGGEASRRLPSADLGGQLPPADPGHQQTAQAAPIRGARRLLLPGSRSQATTGYLTHPV